MKLNQTTIGVGGTSISTTGVELQSMAKVWILRHLGVEKIGAMDLYTTEFAHGYPVITVVLAQEQPWTYITHVFTLAATAR